MISIGVSGAWPTDLIVELAAQVESGGFARLWINDVPNGEALVGVAAAANATTRLRLATGVVALDRWPAPELIARVSELGIPLDRLDLGVGSGAWTHPLKRVSAAVAELGALPSALWLGALGPGMRRLAAEHADGMLLNWLTPEFAREQSEQAAAQAAAVGRTAPSVALYVRTAVDPAADAEVETEAARYASYPGYAANFARLGIDPLATTIRSSDDVRSRLEQFESAAGEVVVRLVLPGEPTLADAARILDAVRP